MFVERSLVQPVGGAQGGAVRQVVQLLTLEERRRRVHDDNRQEAQQDQEADRHDRDRARRWDGSGETKFYDEEYVKELRDEAAANRVKARRGDTAEDRLRAAVIASTVAGVLADPTDLPWSAGLADDEGWPDADKITVAAHNLVTAKPHLGRPSGDLGQGQRWDDADAFSLTEFIRTAGKGNRE